MKIAFVYGPMCIGSRILDFDNLENSPRGLTGSEISCVKIALEMSKLGHDVHLFVHQQEQPQRTWNGITIGSKSHYDTAMRNESWDAVCCWNEPDNLRNVPSSAVRLVNQQLNDFNYCLLGYQDYVDIFTSPSEHHMNYIRKPNQNWVVLPNGCDPSSYEDGKRVQGRVIWASSADRGLHLLLQAWPHIKARVPHASLRCFYNFDYSTIENLEWHPGACSDIAEIAQRIRYCKYAIEKMKHLDVSHHGSVSRSQMREEMNQAMVLGYPCETIRYTEGFSVTTMEACAAGVLPVISDADSLGQIYGSVVPHVKFPASKHMQEFVDLVVRGLSDEDWRASVVKDTKELARKHTWDILARSLEQILVLEMSKKRGIAA